VTIAALIAVGSELLTPLRADTNTLWIAGRLEALGIRVIRKTIVGDEPEAIASAFCDSLACAPLVVSTGGLGPTADDRTREGAALALQRGLRRDAAVLEKLRERYRRRGIRMPAVNEQQADLIEGATLLVNPSGTAPGQWIDDEGRRIVLLPAVPHEMKVLWEREVESRLDRGAAPIIRRVLRIAGVAESRVEELVTPVYARWPGHPVTILATAGEVQLHLSAPGDEAAQLDAMEKEFREALGHRVFGRDDETLEQVVGTQLRRQGARLAVTESCTGGLIAQRITEVAGSSDYFEGGVIAYANAVKQDLLGVSEETLSRYGAVSVETARAMAAGVRRRLSTDWALSVTGIAGPGGGSAEKPVGMVCFGLAGGSEGDVAVERRLAGNRETIRRWAAAIALDLLRRRLVGAPLQE
jgi:competence/damage-inducible protein CinA-like protein